MGTVIFVRCRKVPDRDTPATLRMGLQLSESTGALQAEICNEFFQPGLVPSPKFLGTPPGALVTVLARSPGGQDYSTLRRLSLTITPSLGVARPQRLYREGLIRHSDLSFFAAGFSIELPVRLIAYPRHSNSFPMDWESRSCRKLSKS